MITHRQARALVDSLDADDAIKDRLRAYIRQCEHGPADFDGLSDREHSIRAANRACEAISRVGTLTSDLRVMKGEIDALRASQADFAALFEAVLGMIEPHDQ